jgi:protein O-GlcNAc transferase
MPEVPIPDQALVGRMLANGDDARLRGDLVDALRHYNQASSIAPDDLYARYWLATCYEQRGNLPRAREHCEAGLRIDPKQIGMLLRLGSIAMAARDHKLALDCYLKAAELDPEIPDIDSMLGDQYCLLGEIAIGVEHFNRALRRNPQSARLQSNRLFVLNYASLLAPDQLFAEHRRWGEMHESLLRKHWHSHQNPKDPDRILRVGYVSGDLRDHSVSFFVEPLLAYHDLGQVSVVCFDTSRYPEDSVTCRLKGFGHTWRHVGDIDDNTLAEAVRRERIDILVDLSGHTEMNRLLMFARKPAPVQATWLGYLGTTGLTSMDYRITDAYLDPPGQTERYHTEALYRLPNAACFSPRGATPDVGDLPAARNGYVTFGFVNQWSKVTTSVIECWCEILRRATDSRLIIVARGANNPAFTKEVRTAFGVRGIDTRRVSVRPTSSLTQFLALFEQLDVTLDPFPYGGGTTTMHSLWMGVPVVTLAGHSAFSRNAVGPLTEVGLCDLIGAKQDDYARIAESLTRDIDRLRRIRRGLRSRMLSSPIGMQQSFTRHMETAFHQMWQQYCRSH